MAWAFSDSKSAINLSIPILVAAHLIKIDNTFDIRAYAGPQFYTTIKGVEDGDIDFKNYSIIFGASVDLLNVINVDARVTKHPDADMFYSVGVALLF